MQFKKQQLELDMEQWAGSKLGKEYMKCYCSIKEDHYKATLGAYKVSDAVKIRYVSPGLGFLQEAFV